MSDLVVPTSPEDLDKIESERRKDTRHYWGRLGLLSLALISAFVFLVYGVYASVTGASQRAQIAQLEKSSECRSQLASTYFLAEGTLLTDIVRNITTKSNDVSQLTQDVAVLDAARNGYANVVDICKGQP